MLHVHTMENDRRGERGFGYDKADEVFLKGEEEGEVWCVMIMNRKW